MIPPPPSSASRRIAELIAEFEEQIDAAIRAAQARKSWPAVAQVPAGCHVRDVKKPVFDKYKMAGWRVVHGIGTEQVELYPPIT
jgi:hypothetical protein